MTECILKPAVIVDGAGRMWTVVACRREDGVTIRTVEELRKNCGKKDAPAFSGLVAEVHGGVDGEPGGKRLIILKGVVSSQ